ncbi:MAG: acyltransferase [Eubacterium sp.]|nr:acyltransferase [Eubacterium sp.]
MDQKQSERQIWIDVLKGITICLVVVGHVLQGFEKASGGGYNAVSACILDIICVFHMPLFIVISGFVFSLNYLRIADSQKETVVFKDKKHYRKQIYNLLLIYVMFSILMFCMKFICGRWVNDPVDWFDLLLLPIKNMSSSPYWYLYVLVFLYITGYWMLKRSWNKNFLLLFLFVVSVGYGAFGISGEIMIWRVLYYSFFFIFGCLYQMRNYSAGKGHGLVSCWTLGAAGMMLYLYGKDSMPVFLVSTVKTLTALFVINAFIVTAQRYGNSQNVWSFLGKRSLEIYTLHVFITSGIRPIFKALHMDDYWVNAMVAILLGILIPVLCSGILKKMNLWTVFYKPVELIERKLEPEQKKTSP